MSDSTLIGALREMADVLSGTQPKPAIAFTAVGSELSCAELLHAARLSSDSLVPVIIGPEAAEGFPHYPAADLPEAHRIMEQLLKEGTVAGALTLHYNFALGVTTVVPVRCLATGRQMVLASTTGSSDPRRQAAMVKNAISGLAMADALEIKQPRVGILNVEGASGVERTLAKLASAGFPLTMAASGRADGGALMRGNDLIRGTPDVMVCDSLTGNLLIKLFSAGQSGGEVETTGEGYGIGLGVGQEHIIGIISRASGPATISAALRFCARMAQQKILQRWAERWQQACASGLEALLCQERTPGAGNEQAKAPVSKPPVTVLDDEIHGVDILLLEEAREVLWSKGIYAETGMGCTGPVLMVNQQRREEAIAQLGDYLS